MFKTTSPAVAGTSAELTAKSNPDLSSVDRARVLERLRNDRYTTADHAGRDDVDRWHRDSWNAAIDHAIEIVSQGSVGAGLVELRDAEPKVVLARHWLAELSAFEGEGG